MNTIPSHRTARALLAITLPLWLAACAVPSPAARVEAPTPAGWQAPLPHHGSVADIARWWERAGDPLLAELIAAAQDISPSVAQARGRLAQARASRVSARAALLPSLDGQASASRGVNEQVGGLATTGQAALQASWEVDLFGGNAAANEAALQRLAGAQAQWHEARVSVAAEVANQYSSWRQCLALAEVAASDAASRSQTARLSGQSEQAGFTAPATLALAQASEAEGRVRAEQQRMACEIDLKTLVALTGTDESALRTRAAAAPPAPVPDALFAIDALPARVLAQRPDVYAAEREVAATSADVGSARAQRLPRLTLSGSVGRGWVRTGGATLDSNTWSIGPVGLSLPIFDAGRRAAQVDSAEAQYDAAVQQYRGTVRQAVSEVEQALVRLASTAARSTDAQRAAEGYRTSFTATEARWRGGLASLVELEDSRRTALASESALINLRQERMAAWIGLYRAAGGGWEAEATPQAAAAAPMPPSTAAAAAPAASASTAR
ncbi:efflux transporter outer membrane subunit [Paracidovorax valerianellae]|uniref:Efflux transporter, outer membrane factor (OMF) lipoprotein, NodT family n=1 Tax=Paracidovorax valerianellae TaxID=187868 RepID=A0A1G6RZ48_9BURK|nr:efflux transporter outer membrane subunit [Paracidovorax valerianellae]MDA8444116.1 efflux transporter outer membrane subunit [Paracidovorax valerianellae]SDD09227.1 efflux transporter, outer membrane factor (OMF) lipoprotein, NodT family [Paracidovorax valerianellae]